MKILVVEEESNEVETRAPVISEDIRERKRGEEALRLSEERFRLFIEGVQDYAIFMLSPEGHVVVKDTGIGIKPEDLQRLFREFEQLESGATRRYEGTGLGLALTRKIIELQGGTINVESVVGKGSSFTIELPLVIADINV